MKGLSPQPHPRVRVSVHYLLSHMPVRVAARVGGGSSGWWLEWVVARVGGGSSGHGGSSGRGGSSVCGG